jgi:hypothetical protein
MSTTFRGPSVRGLEGARRPGDLCQPQPDRAVVPLSPPLPQREIAILLVSSGHRLTAVAHVWHSDPDWRAAKAWFYLQLSGTLSATRSKSASENIPEVLVLLDNP